jgi:SPP1 family predicted phage head-tail adaptor
VRFGEQSYRITIEDYTTTTDSALGRVKTWSTYAQPYAFIKYDQGSEGLENDRNTAQVRAVFQVEHNSDTKDIAARMRISHDGEYWDINSILKRGRDRMIELRATKRDS